MADRPLPGYTRNMKTLGMALAALLLTASGAVAAGGRKSPGARTAAKSSSHGTSRAAANGLSRPFASPARSRASFGAASSSKKSAVAAPAPNAPPAVPPSYTHPGALIRSAGQQPQYSSAGGGGTASVDGGGPIAQDPGNSRALGGPGVGWSAPDKRPSANGAGNGSRSGSGAGGTAVTANSAF